jgi:hypothetical protein
MYAHGLSARKYAVQFVKGRVSAWVERCRRCKRRTGRKRYRCGQPGEQHGRLFPSARLSHPHPIRFVCVSAFFGEVTQQIHSLRAMGVIARQVASAPGDWIKAASRSAGKSWTKPPSIDAVSGMLLHLSPAKGLQRVKSGRCHTELLGDTLVISRAAIGVHS